MQWKKQPCVTSSPTDTEILRERRVCCAFTVSCPSFRLPDCRQPAESGSSNPPLQSLRAANKHIRARFACRGLRDEWGLRRVPICLRVSTLQNFPSRSTVAYLPLVVDLSAAASLTPASPSPPHGGTGRTQEGREKKTTATGWLFLPVCC